MILQLGSLLSSVFGGAPGASLTSVLGGAITRAVDFAAPIFVKAGEQFVSGQIQRELNRSSRNDFEDSIKASLRAATNAVSPTAAIGQTAVPAGGPATGTAFAPATLLPPSIQPPQRIIQTNPNFFPSVAPVTFQADRRPPDVFLSESIPVPTTNVNLGTLALKGIQAGVRFGRSLGVSGSRAMTGVAIGGAAVDTALMVGGDLAFPSTAFAPGSRGGFPTQGNPLTITDAQIARSETMPQVLSGIPTGLPRTGNFQREANGCQVQWFFWDGNMGTSPTPVDRGQAACLKRDCIFRLNVFTGKFVKLKGRRMNPMNVRAFFRAGRRVDAGERICRKMFSEHRKTKTGTVRRKRSRKKK